MDGFGKKLVLGFEKSICRACRDQISNGMDGFGKKLVLGFEKIICRACKDQISNGMDGFGKKLVLGFEKSICRACRDQISNGSLSQAVLNCPYCRQYKRGVEMESAMRPATSHITVFHRVRW